MDNAQFKMNPSEVQLAVCGWDEVCFWDLSDTSLIPPEKVWTWKAHDRQDLPLEFRDWFNTTDDCKPFDRGNRILVTSSGSGIALIDRVKDKVLFYGRASNCHSADLLPHNRIAAAASHRDDGSGDRLIIFDIFQSDHELYSAELFCGHGVIWDDERQCLWALSNHDIRMYTLEDWETAAPRLNHTDTISLPEKGGHDFLPVPGTSYISVTTAYHCWFFDRDTKQLSPHPYLGDTPHVKCISHHPVTGQIAYIQASEKCWWSERVSFINPEEVIYIPGEHFYKVRWV